MLSDLELLVMADMYDVGLNPYEPEDVNKYWEMFLS